MRIKKSTKLSNNKITIRSLVAIGFFAAGVLTYPILTDLTQTVNLTAYSPPIAHTNNASSDNLRVCFTPNQSCLPQVLQYINGAKSSIVLLGYSFTSKPMVDALIKAKNRGVKVRLVLDHS
jgi:phosphatidylserine/phosphatidylglycerophosphate/cardiolipin synthase-like enzyme